MLRRILPILLIALYMTGSLQASARRGQFQRVQDILSTVQGNSPRSDVASLPQEAKCGLWMSLETHKQWEFLSRGQRTELEVLLSPPQRQVNRTIGHFKIFYDTTDLNAPTLLDGNYDPVPGSVEAFVDSVGRVFNDVWDAEIHMLGYNAPPLDPDGTYHIYISDLGFGYYGLTTIDPFVPLGGSGAPRYRTYIEIENDFASVYPPSRGIPGLKVTAAHEFHHAIQIGSYATRDDERYFYEITSTWMEDVVYDDVNDYLQYLSNNPDRHSQFAHPEVRFSAYNGSYEYSRCVFGHFLDRRYGRQMMRRIWDHLRTLETFPAMDGALAESGSSFRQAFTEFTYWNSATGPNADTARFYPEGDLYPVIAKRRDLDFVPPSRMLRDSVEAVAALYQPVLIDNDPMLVIVANIDVASARTLRTFPWSYAISTEPIAGGKHLENGLFVRLEVPDPENWFTWESVSSIRNDVFVYPNPFLSGEHRMLKLQIPGGVTEDVHLTVLSSDGRQMFSGDLSPIAAPNADTRIEWDATTDGSTLLNTGVYFYVVSTPSATYRGKFSIIRR